jgi:hypothetical protein
MLTAKPATDPASEMAEQIPSSTKKTKKHAVNLMKKNSKIVITLKRRRRIALPSSHSTCCLPNQILLVEPKHPYHKRLGQLRENQKTDNSL